MVTGCVGQVVAHYRYFLATNRLCQEMWLCTTGGRKSWRSHNSGSTVTILFDLYIAISLVRSNF